MTEYDPLDRIRRLDRILPFLAVLLVPIVPTILWTLFGFVSMKWNMADWSSESRFVFVFISIAVWLLAVAGTKEFCENKLKGVY